MSNGDIYVYLLNCGRFLVWDDESCSILRDECSIFGKFIGLVSRDSQRSKFKGPSLSLGIEEVAILLLEFKSRVKLLCIRSLINNEIAEVTEEAREQYSADMENHRKQMTTLISEERNKKSKNYITVSKGVKRNHDGTEVIVKQHELNHDNVFIHQPCLTPSSWLRSNEYTAIVLEDFHELSDVIWFIWNLPIMKKLHTNLKDQQDQVIKCAVYQYLWNNGHKHLTRNGLKMGGNYLSYPGNPWLHHAKQVIKVVDRDDDQNRSSGDWCGSSRLVISLKKELIVLWYTRSREIILDQKKEHITEFIKSMDIEVQKVGRYDELCTKNT